MRAISIVIVLGAAALARADAIQQADALFDEGQKLKASGDKKGACGKFSEALKLNHKAIAVPKLGLPVTVKKTPVGKILAFGGTGVALAAIGIGWYAHHKWEPLAAQCTDPGPDMTLMCPTEINTRAQHYKTIGDVGT